MRKITWVLLLIVLVLLAVTNPNQSAFRDYVQNRIEKQNSSGNGLEQTLRDVFSGPLADVVAESTERSNYVLLSIYRLEVGAKKSVYIGIAGNFIPLSEELMK